MYKLDRYGFLAPPQKKPMPTLNSKQLHAAIVYYPQKTSVDYCMTINNPHLLEDTDFTSQLPILFTPADPHPRLRPAGKLSVGHERMISQFHGHFQSWWRYVYFCFPPDFSQRCCLLGRLFVGKPSHDFQASKVCADHDFP